MASCNYSNSQIYDSNMHLEYILLKLSAKCSSIQLCTPYCTVCTVVHLSVHIHLPQRKICSCFFFFFLSLCLFLRPYTAIKT